MAVTVLSNMSHQIKERVRHLASTSVFAHMYVTAATSVLLISTTFWAVLGAQLNLTNADQLVNPYLFQDQATFQGAMIPGSHSFLLKWPLFWLIKVLGFGSNAYVAVTVFTVLVTVALFALTLFWIERRPVVFGTICLALASVLLLVPPTAYAGALLPVNMAMLTTRNIEYVIYIFSLLLMTRGRSLRSGLFWAGVLLLAVLIASDKLFLSLTIGGAALALIAYGLSRGLNLVSAAARWMIGGLLGGIAAIGILWAINFTHLTRIVNQSGVGPYGLIHNPHELALGMMYGVLHILTNFGANPASQVTLLRDVPHAALTQLFGVSGISFVINGLVLLATLGAAYRIIGHSLTYHKDKDMHLSDPLKLAIGVLVISVAAAGIFALSNHYYAADARYLTIITFGLFIALTTYASQREWQSGRLAVLGIVLITGIVLAIPNVLKTYHADVSAVSPLQARNERVADAVKQHPVKVLVGDYWRVIPIKSELGSTQTVQPLADCTTPRDTLNSSAWQPNLQTTSFGYILSLDGSFTDYPRCTLDQVVAKYGRPNARAVIAGTAAHPTELVLFYDRGAK